MRRGLERLVGFVGLFQSRVSGGVRGSVVAGCGGECFDWDLDKESVTHSVIIVSFFDVLRC